MNNSREYKGTCTECGTKNCDLVIVDEEHHVCKKCLAENYFLCEECNEYWSYDFVEFYHLKDGRTVCENCIEDFEESEIDEE